MEIENELWGTVSEVERCTTVDGPGIRSIVFLKGCPLHCLWCHNPENIKPDIQFGWDKNKCIGCRKCVSGCRQKAIEETSDGLITNRDLCAACGDCVEICPAKARKQFGTKRTVTDVFREVVRDKGFYEKSHGGVTVSGGEPLFQPEFTRELFRKCHAEGIHTALDTSGFAGKEALLYVLEETDLVLLDLKQIDPELHKNCTGVNPAVIFENLKRINELGIPTWIRTPVVPGYTDQESNIEGIAKLISETECVKVWDMLPYHGFGEKKYNELGIGYALHDISRPSEEKMKKLREIANTYCGTRILVR